MLYIVLHLNGMFLTLKFHFSIGYLIKDELLHPNYKCANVLTYTQHTLVHNETICWQIFTGKFTRVLNKRTRYRGRSTAYHLLNELQLHVLTYFSQ